MSRESLKHNNSSFGPPALRPKGLILKTRRLDPATLKSGGLLLQPMAGALCLDLQTGSRSCGYLGLLLQPWLSLSPPPRLRTPCQKEA